MNADVPALGELARLATADAAELNSAAQEYEDSADACDTPALAGFRRRRYVRAKALRAAADRVLQLVALATGGADSELLDGLLDDALSGMREPMTLADARDVRDMLTRVQVERKKAKVRAARSLTPERPADA